MKTTMFKDDMLKATLELRKTNTRRLGGLKEINRYPDHWKYLGQDDKGFCFQNNIINKSMRCFSRYKVGDIVGIKENYIVNQGNILSKKVRVRYKFDMKKIWIKLNDREWGKFIIRKKPYGSISKLFMFDSMIRYKIKIKDVRVERVQDIILEDCIKEGIDMETDYASMLINQLDSQYDCEVKHTDIEKMVFKKLWDSINKKQGYGWDKNPWTFPYTFKLI